MKRRTFLQVSALSLGGLLLGLRFPLKASAAGERRAPALSAWLRIAPDGTVTVLVPKAENGQGITTALAMLLAEELEVPWESVRFELIAPTSATMRFLTPETSGSRSVREAWEPLRAAGATARELLVRAAAARWKSAAAHCRAEAGFVAHRDGRRLSYGELAAEAAKLPVPRAPKLKEASAHRLLGRPQPRLDALEKANGRARFGIDASLPGMLVASIRLAPRKGARLANMAELRKAAAAGVRIEPIPGGVAALAPSFWQAEAALRSTPPRFTGGLLLDSSAVSAALEKALSSGGKVSIERGRLFPAMQPLTVSAFYEVPFLAHATMETLTCLASVKPGACELWTGSKLPDLHRALVAKELGIPVARVTLHQQFLGGSFGRRGEPEFVLQAVELSRRLRRPVKVIWPREEDIRHDTYRPAFAARLEALLDGKQVLSWKSVNAGQGISHLRARARKREAVDRNSIDYWHAQHYAIPHRRIAWASVELPVPVGFWRSTGASQNAFFVESFVDEIAHATGEDPLALRLRLCMLSPRARAVLEAAAKAARWNEPPPAGQALGIALSEVAETLVAQVARVSVVNGEPRVHEITCAYDCGPVVNPDGAAAQIEGGVIFGLSAALFGEISLAAGEVRQSNFHDYRMVRMFESPKITVVRVPSEGPPGGIGEVAVPGVAPAVCNALFRLTGKRIRRLPIASQAGS